MTFPEPLAGEARELLVLLEARAMTLATAESCTGGLIAGLLTAIPGSSRVFDRGFITYSNESKQEMLGVPASLIALHGAVSEEVARSMAEGALRHSRSAVAVSVTGVAGPDGGTAEKPVGLVHFGCAAQGQETVHAGRRFGDIGRDAIRLASVLEALRLVRRVAEG